MRAEPVSYVDVEGTLMECSEPGVIRDEELIAYAEGEKVRPAVKEHLAHCEACSSRLATYQQLEHRLAYKLYRWDCPPSQILGEFQLGLLDTVFSTAVKTHVRSCLRCSADVMALTHFLANDPFLVEPAVAGQKSAQKAALNGRYPVEEAKRALEHLRDQTLAGARRIVATLLPPVQPAFAMQRNPAQQLAQWPRNYTAEDVNISLQLESNPRQHATLQLIGLVTCKGVVLEALQGIPVRLVDQAGIAYTQNIDELGNFVFAALSPATYTLELLFPEGAVVVDQILLQLPE
ncbi:MAG: hypothetical protein NVSMB44_38420 [Ktedonobacteraceae bacterium]